MRAVIAIVFVLLLSSVTLAEFRQETKSEKISINPKQVTEARFRIVQSGSLAASGDIDKINMTLAIPQEGVEDIKVTAESWRYASDRFGNRQLLLEWKNPKGTISYRVETTVTNKANMLLEEKAIGTDPAYLRENDQVRFTAELRKIAFPFERSLKRAAELTKWVHSYINYDLSLVGQLKPSDWVYENRRGVCVEYSNLLSALLKISGIPTRYVVGYAYSSVENRLIGHAWVEILSADGSWIPLDATWLQAGYLDATHIKTAVTDDANQTERLTYSGKGDINVAWKRNQDEVHTLDFKTDSPTAIGLSVTGVAFNQYGLAKATISAASCTIADVNLTSCVDESGGRLLNIVDAQRGEWVCPAKQVYWVYNVSARLREGFSYRCPLTAYDQTGSTAEATVEIAGKKAPEDVEISGPDTAAIKESFVLLALAKDDFTFFSPRVGSSQSRFWNLSLSSPGRYSFYLYSGGALATKVVEIVEKKEFSITATAPKNVTLNGTFILSVVAESLLGRQKAARLRIDYDDQIIERELSFLPAERKNIDFNLTAARKGARKISAAVLSDTISSYSLSILVYQEKAGGSIIDAVMGAIAAFFSAIVNFIGGLLPR